MGTRLELHQELTGFANYVYYHPPANVHMQYPCIVYHLSKIDTKHADNMNYHNFKTYEVTYIAPVPEDSIIDRILEHFQFSGFDRPYTADDLHHYVFHISY